MWYAFHLSLMVWTFHFFPHQQEPAEIECLGNYPMVSSGGQCFKEVRRTLQDRGRGMIQQNEMSVGEREREIKKEREKVLIFRLKKTLFWLHNHVLFVPHWWTESHENTKLHLGSASRYYLSCWGLVSSLQSWVRH